MNRMTLTTLGLAALVATACAPTAQVPRSTFVAAPQAGYAQRVTYGTIIGTSPVTVGSEGGLGLGSGIGAVAGGLGGSFIGGDWRTNALMGLAGAAVGGLAGGAAEQRLSRTSATRFIVRTQRGDDVAIIQTNEEGLEAGETVAILDGHSPRIIRAQPAPRV